MSFRAYEEIMMEHFDVLDSKTRSTLLSIDEADQNKVLESLTSKLYKSIMDKVDDIDFGSIPETKGDITKLENYEELLECTNTIKGILIEYRQDTAPVDTILLAISNIQERKAMFEKAYTLKLQLPIVMYNTMVLAVVSSISLLISTSIDFIKDTGSQSYEIKLDKVAYVKSKNGLLFRDLDKFNKSCASGEFDKCMDHVFTMGSKQLLGSTTLTAVAVASVIGIIITIIPLLRELVFFFFNCKQSVSDYFAIQSELLQINAQNLRDNELSSIPASERKVIAKKQDKVVGNFRKISNALEVKVKTGEAKAVKDVASSNKKYKIDDIATDKLDSAPDDSSIF